MSSVRGGPFTRMIEERHFRNLSHFAQAYVEERCAAEPLPSAKAVATMSPHAAEQLKRAWLLWMVAASVIIPVLT